MKKSKKSGSNDPLSEELNFEKLEIVAYGPGWKKKPQYSRSPEPLPRLEPNLLINQLH